MLCFWLNGHYRPKEKRQRKRVLKILGLLQELTRVVRSDRERRVAAWAVKKPEGMSPQVYRIEKELEALTSRYQSWLRFGAENDSSGIGVAHMRGKGGTGFESTGLEIVRRLVEARLIDGLILCETCKCKWVFQYGSKGRYCGRQCRDARYEQSVERKAKKAVLNREYYQRTLKSLRKKSKRQKGETCGTT